MLDVENKERPDSGEQADDEEQLEDSRGGHLVMTRRMSAAQLREYRLLNEELENDIKSGRFQREVHSIASAILEPWEFIDPTTEHLITLVCESTGVHSRRSCGAVQSGETLERAKLAARTHRGHVIRAAEDYGSRLPAPTTIAVLERGQTPEGSRFRWMCDACSEHGEWLACEPIVVLGSILHHEDCAAWELLRDRRPEGARHA